MILYFLDNLTTINDSKPGYKHGFTVGEIHKEAYVGKFCVNYTCLLNLIV